MMREPTNDSCTLLSRVNLSNATTLQWRVTKHITRLTAPKKITNERKARGRPWCGPDPTQSTSEALPWTPWQWTSIPQTGYGRRKRQQTSGSATLNTQRNQVAAANDGSSAVDDDEVCELVNDLDVELGDEEEGFSGYYIQALKNNNGAGVLLLSDVYGHESSGIRDSVYRLACFGYKYDLAPIFCWRSFSIRYILLISVTKSSSQNLNFVYLNLGFTAACRKSEWSIGGLIPQKQWKK